MASNGTRVTAEALATAIQNYESRNQEFHNAYNKIFNIVDNLKTNYKSEAATVFYDKFETIKNNLSQTENQMTVAINKLKQIKEIYEALTAMQQALVNALENTFAALGNIFG